MMVHNAYRKKNSPTCYIQIMNSTSDYKVVLNKVKTKGALIFNTIDDCYFCDCADCKKAAEEEGTDGCLLQVRPQDSSRHGRCEAPHPCCKPHLQSA